MWLHMLSVPLSHHPYTLSEGNGKLNILLFRSHMSEFYRMEKKRLPQQDAPEWKHVSLFDGLNFWTVYVRLSADYLQHLSVVFLSAFFFFFASAGFTLKHHRKGTEAWGSRVDVHFKILYSKRNCLYYYLYYYYTTYTSFEHLIYIDNTSHLCILSNPGSLEIKKVTTLWWHFHSEICCSCDICTIWTVLVFQINS